MQGKNYFHINTGNTVLFIDFFFFFFGTVAHIFLWEFSEKVDHVCLYGDMCDRKKTTIIQIFVVFAAFTHAHASALKRKEN